MNAPVPISDSGGPTLVGSRRASRACASCRRDKIRCDGPRPCNSCVKKGYPGDQCTNGCEPCRKARVRCEEGNGKPCKRCREMNLHCILDGPQAGVPHYWAPNLAFADTHIQDGGLHHRSPILASIGNPGKRSDEFDTGVRDFSASTNGSLGNVTVGLTLDQTIVFNGSGQGKLPRGTERAKLACVACRRDNKKCDDHRPCSRCVARSEECIHVTRGPKLVKLRCEGCREDNKRCEESRPCKYCLDTEKECINVLRKGRGHGTRVKSACVSCRRDKIRCNGDRPCLSCVKKGCDCIERACPNCATEGKGSECTHRRSAEGASSGSPSSDNSSPSNTKISSKEKDYHFVPSEDDSRWISFTTSSGAQTIATVPSLPPPPTLYSGQQHGAPTAENEYYSYLDSGMSDQAAQLETPSLTTMHDHLYGHLASNPAASYFFDGLDPGNYQLAQHMASTSNNRTFLPS